jgi:hypothetical protein
MDKLMPSLSQECLIRGGTVGFQPGAWRSYQHLMMHMIDIHDI